MLLARLAGTLKIIHTPESEHIFLAGERMCENSVVQIIATSGHGREKHHC
jgi:hypothetical protein